MATPLITLTGDGTAPVVSITFDVIDQAYVKATVNGVNAPFTWTGPSQITFSNAAPIGADVRVYRDTPISTPLVDYADPAVLTASDLDLADKQLRHHQEEVDTRVATSADVAAAATAADASADAASASAAAAANSATTASNSETAAAASETAAAASQTAAAASQTAAAASATAAATSETNAAASEVAAAAAVNLPNAHISAESRAILAALATTTPAVLAEEGREGLFVFDSANLAAEVTADTAQGIYVPPTSDPTGGNGAWVRRFSGAADPRWFGAVGDGVTDDAVALQAWLDHGGDLFLPPLQFYSSVGLIVRKQVHLHGTSYGFDSREAGYADMPGSRIRFAAGVRGFDVQPQTTLTDVATVLGLGGAAFTQEGAYGSTFKDFALIGPNAGAVATGFFGRTLLHVDNVHVVQFMGKAFDISATSDTPDGNDYGNASASSLRNCVALDNGSHGFHIRGRDANTILIENCNAKENGGIGFLEESLLGNSYIKNHAAGNIGGSYKSIGGVNESTYDFNYVEGDAFAGAVINSLNKIRGGGLEGVNVPTDFAPWSIGGYIQKVHEVRFYWGWTDPAAITGYARQFRSTINGLVLQGEGGTYDVSLYNKSGTAALRIPTGTQNVYAEGSVSGNGLITRDGYLKRSTGDQIIHSPAGGETSFFAVGTGIYRWFNAANAQHTSLDNAGNWNYTGNLALAAATQISVGGVKILGGQGAAVTDAAALTSADATVAAAAPTKAEFDALVAEFNKLRDDLEATRTTLNTALARLRASTGHGLIA